MNTIRKLCDRVIVLKKGKIIFDGDVENGIRHYLSESFIKNNHADFKPNLNDPTLLNGVKITSIDVDNIDFNSEDNKKLGLKINLFGFEDLNNLTFRLSIFTAGGNIVGTTFSNLFSVKRDTSCARNVTLDISSLTIDDYYLKIMIYEIKNETSIVAHERIEKAVCFSVLKIDDKISFLWKTNFWGNVVLPTPADE